jgi:hypothetical protein
LLVDESADAEEPQMLVAFYELPVRERDAGPDFSLRAPGARRVREEIRYRVVHAHGKIRRRHFDIPCVG